MTDDLPEHTNVIRAKFTRGPGDPRRSPIRTKNASMACPHEEVVFDEEARTVECDSCAAVLNAFDAMVTFAKEWEQHDRWWRSVRRAADRETERSLAADKDRARALAALSRARRQTALAPGERAELEILRQLADTIRKPNHSRQRALLNSLRLHDRERDGED